MELHLPSNLSRRAREELIRQAQRLLKPGYWSGEKPVLEKLAATYRKGGLTGQSQDPNAALSARLFESVAGDFAATLDGERKAENTRTERMTRMFVETLAQVLAAEEQTQRTLQEILAQLGTPAATDQEVTWAGGRRRTRRRRKTKRRGKKSRRYRR